MGEPEKQNKPKNSEETLKESLNALHPAKPSENIAILDTSPQPSEELLEKLHETISFGKIQSISEVKSEASSRVKSQSEEKIEALKSGNSIYNNINRVSYRQLHVQSKMAIITLKTNVCHYEPFYLRRVNNNGHQTRKFNKIFHHSNCS